MYIKIYQELQQSQACFRGSLASDDVKQIQAHISCNILLHIKSVVSRIEDFNGEGMTFEGNDCDYLDAR